MIDIETLGNGPSSMVLSIAAVKFNQVRILDQIELFPDVQEQAIQGQKMDIDTLIWWQKNKEILSDYLTKPRKSLHFCYHQLAYFLADQEPDTLIWAKSPRFDLQILENMWAKYPHIWTYRNQGDVRLVEWSLKNQSINLIQPTKAHNALSDAIAQAQNVQQFLLI